MTQWEYFVLRMTDNNWAAQMTELNQVGRDGWELVMVDDGVAYLKRVKLSEAALGVTVTSEMQDEWRRQTQSMQSMPIMPFEPVIVVGQLGDI